MKKSARTKCKVVIVLLLVSLCLGAVLGIWLYGYTQGQSEACRKWEELKSQNEQKELQLESSYPELQQGVSILQAEALRYREICQE